MELAFENIRLRDMVEEDIEDYVRWFTTERDWMDYDAPWEQEETTEEAERQGWREYYDSVKELPDSLRRWKFEIEGAGKHLGWVCAYHVDENYEWTAEPREEQKTHLAVGIDLCERGIWSRGVGTNALRAYIRYLFENGVEEVYTQTWSGNIRMIRVAEKLGFREICRKKNYRCVRGEWYDGLTFVLRKT